MPTAIKKGKPAKAVSFRLATSYAIQLIEGADRRGVSPGDYARSIVIDFFEHTEIMGVADEVSELREEVRELSALVAQFRKDFDSVVRRK